MNAEKQSQLKIASQVWIKSNYVSVTKLCLQLHKIYLFKFLWVWIKRE